MGWDENVKAIRRKLCGDQPYRFQKWLIFEDPDHQEIRIRWYEKPRWFQAITLTRKQIARLKPENALKILETEIAIRNVVDAGDS